MTIAKVASLLFVLYYRASGIFYLPINLKFIFDICKISYIRICIIEVNYNCFLADLFGGSPMTDTPPPWDHTNHPQAPSGLFGQPSLPYPTNVWWQNLVLNSGEGVAAVLPYSIRTKDSGYHVNLPRKVR